MLKPSTFFESLETHFKKNLPFVAYAKPNTDEVYALLQQDNELIEVKDFTESGFVFAPFNSNDKTILFPLQKSTKLETNREAFNAITGFKQKSTSINDAVESFHIHLVKKAIEAINKNHFKKVVLSRVEVLEFEDFNVFSVFKKLLNTYKTAFVYCWYHPNIGLWLGATPEHLLKINGQQFSTMALAGTQSFKGNLEVEWQKKELEEQQFVTNFLVTSLKPIVEQLNVSKTKTIKAGRLLHLQTDITARLKNNNLKALIKSLHPTPATCGLPKEDAKAFILKNENYNRAYYTGFLGELNYKVKSSRNSNRRNVENNAYVSIKNETNLYVNLRCMQIKQNKAMLYVGGGVTKDSIPEKEWQETVNKTKTMKNVLN